MGGDAALLQYIEQCTHNYEPTTKKSSTMAKNPKEHEKNVPS